MVAAKKQIKQNQMRRYFIASTKKIIQTDGYQNVTIRKVSTVSGYNSATIYNYFENIDELISFALIDFVFPYLKTLTKVLKSSEKSYLTFLMTWKTYATFSFKEPAIYTYVFYSEKTATILSKLGAYLELYAELGSDSAIKITDRSLGASIEERDDLAIDPCIKDGYLARADKAYITKFSYALALGMCQQILVEHADPTEMTKQFVDYQIDFLLHHSKIPLAKSVLLYTVLNEIPDAY